MLEPFRDLIRRLVEWAYLPAQPGAMYVFCEELPMHNLFRARVLIPPVAGHDVANRTLLRTMNGDPSTTVTLDISLGEHETSFKAKQGDTVHLELRQVDDAGNVSEPSLLDFTVIDTVPPETPGPMTVTLEELPEEPTPDEPPAPVDPVPVDPVPPAPVDPTPVAPPEPAPEEPTL